MGYVETGVQGWTEIRVHGVSGTTAPALLDHPNVTRVAGNAAAGFYRRSWESPASAEDDAEHHVEAYSWGGLTSGDWTRALWLLLLPFMLLNVAFYMTPASPLGESRGWRWLRSAGESVQRLLALSLTVTFSLAAVTVAMDLLGWQCANARTRCAAGPWLAFYQWEWMGFAGRRLAVTTLIPIAVVTLLWWLGRRTWAIAEDVAPPAAPAAGANTWQSPLEDRAFWNGRGPVARLRSLHVGTAYAVIGLFLTAPLVRPELLTSRHGPLALADRDAWAAPGPALVSLLAVGFVAVIVMSFAWVAHPAMGRRERPTGPGDDGLDDGLDDGPPGGRDFTNPQRVVSFVAVLLLAVTWSLAWFSDRLLGTPSLTRAHGGLPWLAGATISTFAVQLLLLAALGLVCALQARWHPRRLVRPATVDTCAPGAIVVRSHTAWGGLGTLVFAGLAWALAGGFAAAATVRLADVLGTPRPPHNPQGVADDKLIVLPMEYFWAAATAVPVLLVVVIGAVAVLARVSAVATGLSGRVVASYGPSLPAGVTAAPDAPRTRTIARIWARATVTERLRKVMIFLALAVAVVLLAAVVLRLACPDWVVTTALLSFLVPAGGFVMTGFVLGLLWVGRRAYRDANFRRTVGILWDLGTFWPRATHPLAPPCYAERTIPDLLGRIEYLRASGGRVVLSCHSQGTVIGAATIAAMTYEGIERTAFLTYGSPLRRLYTRFFPAYFGVGQLVRVGDLLSRGRAATGTPDGAEKLSAEVRSRWPWVNLYRRSDPIGGPVLVGNPPFLVGRTAPEAADLDWHLLDPAYLRRPGDSVDPAPQGHSCYPQDPAFETALREVRRRRCAGATTALPSLPPELSSPNGVAPVTSTAP